MNTTKHIISISKEIPLIVTRGNSHLKNIGLIHTLLANQDTLTNSQKLKLLALERHYMIKYLKSIRIRVETNILTAQGTYRTKLQGFYSYVLRRLRSVDKYIPKRSLVKKIKVFCRIHNVTRVHWDRFVIPHFFLVKRSKNLIGGVKNTLKHQIRKFRIELYSTLLSEVKCRIIEFYKYKIPNYIKYRMRKY